MLCLTCFIEIASISIKSMAHFVAYYGSNRTVIQIFWVFKVIENIIKYTSGDKNFIDPIRIECTHCRNVLLQWICPMIKIRFEIQFSKDLLCLKLSYGFDVLKVILSNNLEIWMKLKNVFTTIDCWQFD